MTADHDTLMAEALREAEAALAIGELPIGAVLAFDGAVVARSHWDWKGRDLLAHPEMLVIRQAGRSGAGLYTTLEPCVMCIGAAMSSFISTVVFALESPSDGAGDVPAMYAERFKKAETAPASIPEVIGGVRRDASLELVRRYCAVEGDDAVRRWAQSLIR